MHQAASDYVEGVVRGRRFESVLEIGARDINGSIRSLFGDCRYVGLDIAPGPGVDVVADGSTYRTDAPVDCVVCCEVMEHTPAWPQIIDTAYQNLAPGGTLIITAASGKRAPHSAIDGQRIRGGEYYGNVQPGALDDSLSAFAVRDVRQVGNDVQATAVKQPTFVVVPVKNRLDLTQTLVNQLRQMGGFHSLLVLDNGSTDGTVEWLEAEGVTYEVLPEANIYQLWNKGWPDLTGEYQVCFLNNDITFGEGTVQDLAEELRAHDLAAISPLHMSRDSLGQGIKVRPFLSGFAFMVRGEMPNRFDEQFEWYYGDDDFWSQMNKAGGKMAYSQRVKIGHIGSASSKGSALQTEAGPRDKQRFRRKWG